jgi:hypothetical protein
LTPYTYRASLLFLAVSVLRRTGQPTRLGLTSSLCFLHFGLAQMTTIRFARGPGCFLTRSFSRTTRKALHPHAGQTRSNLGPRSSSTMGFHFQGDGGIVGGKTLRVELYTRLEPAPFGVGRRPFVAQIVARSLYQLNPKRWRCAVMRDDAAPLLLYSWESLSP